METYSIEQFANSKRLPTLPEVALKMVEIAQQDEPDIDELAQIIRSDPVVSGNVLKTANSALFGMRHRTETIEQAIPKLGLTLLRTLVLSFHLSRHETHQQQLEPVLQNLWRSSLTQAAFAELIAENLEGIDPQACFLAAMLQDIGILAMVSEMPREYLEIVLDRARFPNVAAAERSHFGFCHVDVSAAIVRNWGFENAFADSILHHHDHIAVQEPELDNPLNVILQSASLGATVLHTTRSSESLLDASLEQWICLLNSHFGFTETETGEIISDVTHRVLEYSSLFNFNIGETVQIERVVDEAKTLLQEIALKNQLELISQEITSKKNDGVEDELFRDCLSGLYNRRFMNQHLNDKLVRSIKKKKPIALMFLDIDSFKLINDTWGHLTGDKAIQHVATWLTESIRQEDIAIRLGGDEFLVVLQEASEKQFRNIADRIVREIPPMALSDGEEVVMSLSVGCSIYQPVRGDVANANWLIEQADQSMYQAKKSGGDSIAVQKFVGSELVEA